MLKAAQGCSIFGLRSYPYTNSIISIVPDSDNADVGSLFLTYTEHYALAWCFIIL